MRVWGFSSNNMLTTVSSAPLNPGFLEFRFKFKAVTDNSNRLNKDRQT